MKVSNLKVMRFMPSYGGLVKFNLRALNFAELAEMDEDQGRRFRLTVIFSWNLIELATSMVGFSPSNTKVCVVVIVNLICASCCICFVVMPFISFDD
ncbi:hypothetical protein JRO89_XS07G0137800 [Xanthoceras sorbifolium]|uniref:Transmembrane protein n=1 Tax=Xanthoceras sorbifolium TaxID=99658 RepID=A0ABQ8HTP5_9ROSI|nr:hypothetical protein JRO89_XS07G0137800 [Xanthoceras sorbifolium]